MREHVRRIHFIGIGGSGMSGLAEVLLNLGYEVSGSDQAATPVTTHLKDSGIAVNIGHDAKLVGDCDVVVVSSAINGSNPEVAAAKASKIPVIPRAEMLAELMRFRKGIAVAGTHGKTTTTSLVASVLARGGLDPTFVVGGMVNSAGRNAVLGTGDYLVAEADESDASFLHLQPEIAVITNIDTDHMDAYSGDFKKLKKTFIDFLQNLPFYGLAVLCLDDTNVQSILPAVRKPILTYGAHPDADVRLTQVSQDGLRMRFEVARKDHTKPLEIELALPGVHNACNALAAIAIGTQLGVSDADIITALKDFAGIGRRFHIRGEIKLSQGSALVVDDYGHHPREIAATLQAARGAWPERRLVVVFQPHRFSRTRDLMDDFSQLLSAQEPLLITEVYPAGEAPISGADGRALCRAIRARGRVDPVFVPSLTQLAESLRNIVRDRDVVLTLGAGDIGRASQNLVATGLGEET
ncbi:MAG: UDP-N-acetylmuramate--L-alanine ligase [Arenicellales bacterium]|nr:UDP-N-acetylmuramate--L-alanine ligase [Arenicellales bacterium]